MLCAKFYSLVVYVIGESIATFVKEGKQWLEL